MSDIKQWEYFSVYVDREDYIKGWIGKSFKPDKFNEMLNGFGSEGTQSIIKILDMLS